MNKKLKLMSLLGLLVLLFAMTPGKIVHSIGLSWAKRIGGVYSDDSRGMVIDSARNIYITGFFAGTVDFDPGSGVTELTSVGDSVDIFICKLDSAGNFLWAKSIGGSLTDEGYAIAVDDLGNIFITGSYEDTVDFDPDEFNTYYLTSAGGKDIFVSKLDSSGNFVWAKSMGGNLIDVAYAIVVDSYGNVFTSGFYAGTADFDPDPDISSIRSSIAGSRDIFVSKLDVDGVWAGDATMGNTGVDETHALTIDIAGNIYISGFFEGSVDFDPSSADNILTSAGGRDIFVSKLDNGLNHVWAGNMGGSDNDEGLGIEVDSAGYIYSTGFFAGTADFDPDEFNTVDLTSAGGSDIFISKLTDAGAYVWAGNMGGAEDDEGHAITVDILGNIYANGFFRGTADFDPGPGTAGLTSNGLKDIFVNRLDNNGTYFWVKNMGGPEDDEANAIAHLDNVFSTGYFRDTADFDPGPNTYNLTSAGESDIFVSSLPSGPTFEFYSVGKFDGIVQKGFAQAEGNLLSVGDLGLNDPRRVIMHFKTGTIPDDAIIEAVTLYFMPRLVVNSPLTELGPLYAELNTPFFGTRRKLQRKDFWTTAQKYRAATVGPELVGGWYIAHFEQKAFDYINKTGTTQVRLRFYLRSDFDYAADLIYFYSGSALKERRPRLVILYSIP